MKMIYVIPQDSGFCSSALITDKINCPEGMVIITEQQYNELKEHKLCWQNKELVRCRGEKPIDWREKFAIKTKEDKEGLVEQYIREVLSINQELEILRERDEKPAQFETYNAFVKDCIKRAEEELKQN